ncbi:MAG: hypothetical protein PHC54_03185, partial [Candidatus Omnitrophica bacterium]|nr:hypothetical protein [Candidatus Omnitrophota bacterium]MDD5592447.1 hypothetical protein [Candidatus Omnitrophota bacterium]
TGPISTLYGVYIANMTRGTDNYAIYSAGAKSYFAGNVGIGTTSPATKLEVNGNVKLTAITSGTGAGTQLCIGTDSKVCACGQCN